MQKIQIPYSVLAHQQPYLFKNGKVDFIGAILLENRIVVTEGSRFPSDLKLEIFPFTRSLRRRILDTPLTLSIITLSAFPLKEALPKLNQLLAPYYFIEMIHR